MLEGVHREKPHDRARLKFENRSRTTRSRFLYSCAFFLRIEGNFGGNQLPDGSIRLSPLCRRRMICPSISKRAFARDSPDFAFFRHFSRFSRALLLLKTTLKITVSGRCACVCACVCCVLCMLCAVLCYIFTKNMRN